MTCIYIVRHGETEWNREEVFRGRADIPLNERGKAQAEAAARALANVKFTACFSSPLSRAFETATIISKPHGLTPKTEVGFNDLDFGQWQGLPHLEVKRKFPEMYELWKTTPHRVKFPRGETLDDVGARSMTALERLVEIHDQKTILIVTHRVLCKIILCAALDLDNSHFWRIKQDTCCINRLTFTPEKTYIIEVINDTCHLAGIHPSHQRDF